MIFEAKKMKSVCFLFIITQWKIGSADGGFVNVWKKKKIISYVRTTFLLFRSDKVELKRKSLI